MLRCDSCHKRIEELSEEEALNDITPHGWTNLTTAHSTKCFDCASDNDDYETYYAGRIKRGYPNRVYQKVPDVTNLANDTLVEVFFERKELSSK